MSIHDVFSRESYPSIQTPAVDDQEIRLTVAIPLGTHTMFSIINMKVKLQLLKKTRPTSLAIHSKPVQGTKFAICIVAPAKWCIMR